MRFSRLLRHPRVTVEAIVSDAAVKTGVRAFGLDVLAIQDSSTICLGGDKCRNQGYGPVGHGEGHGGAARGLLLHSVLAVDAESGEVLGLADVEVWNRKEGKKVSPRAGRKLEEKESHRWIRGAEKAASVLADARQITVVADRESDIYEDIARCPKGVRLLTRARHNRCLEGGGNLFASVDQQAPVGDLQHIDIPAKTGRPARQAKLAIRFTAANILAPDNGMPAQALKQLPKSLRISIVDILEVDPPGGVTPIHWRLITTHVVEDLATALRMLAYYRKRWYIEEYFRCLKSGGFNIEKAEIADPKVMAVFAAAIAVAAVTVLQLIKARDKPEVASMASLFDAKDQKIIAAINAKYEGPNPRPRQKNPHPPESLAHATWVIGRLGGWTGYYGKPGPETLNRGIQRLENIKFGTSLTYKDV